MCVARRETERTGRSKIITRAHGHRLRDIGVRTTRCNLGKIFDHTHERKIVLSLNGGFIEGPIMIMYVLLGFH